jgi:hypothetical protein
MIVVRCDYCGRPHDDRNYQNPDPPLQYPYAALAYLPSGWVIQFDRELGRCQITCAVCRKDRVHPSSGLAKDAR